MSDFIVFIISCCTFSHGHTQTYTCTHTYTHVHTLHTRAYTHHTCVHTYINTHLLCTAGLKLRLQKQTAPLQSFSYALFPTMEKSSPVGWQYLVTEQEETENIRLHSLQEGDKLPQLLDDFKQSYAKAVILINLEDSYEVSEELVSSVTTPPLPLLIVKKTDGEEILRCIERHDGESIHAKVDAENQVDAGNREEEVDRVSNQQGDMAVSAADKKQSTEQASISGE